MLMDRGGCAMRACVGHGVKQLVGYCLDRRSHPADAPGSECPGNQAPDPVVTRSVQVQDPVGAMDEDSIGSPAGQIPVKDRLIETRKPGSPRTALMAS